MGRKPKAQVIQEQQNLIVASNAVAIMDLMQTIASQTPVAKYIAEVEAQGWTPDRWARLVTATATDIESRIGDPDRNIDKIGTMMCRLMKLHLDLIHEHERFSNANTDGAWSAKTPLERKQMLDQTLDKLSSDGGPDDTDTADDDSDLDVLDIDGDETETDS